MTDDDRAALTAAGLPVGEVETVASASRSASLRSLVGVLDALRRLEREWIATPDPVRQRMERLIHLTPNGAVHVFTLEREP